ncbi:MAG: deoxynucleoside kinase [Bacteroidetes bacterium]|nr:deoxynucleoside kinase [Bacteroidota bacterium]
MVTYKYIAIEGCIGAGKTELSLLLAKRLGAKLMLEQFEDNPFLPKFYGDKRRYAFPLEMSFLASRYHQLSTDLQQDNLFENFIVADYIIQKCLLFSRLTLDEEEYKLYNRLFQIIQLNCPAPDLLVYIYRDTTQLMKHIKERNRDYERSIDETYLDNIQNGYLEMFKNHTSQRILLLDAHHFDYVGDKNNFEIIFRLLQQDYPIGVTKITL